MPEKKKRIEVIEKESQDAEFWSDPKKSGKLSQELAGLKEEVEVIDVLKKEFKDVKELSEISEEKDIALPLEKLEKKVAKEEFRTFLSGKNDKGDALFTITAGAGGQDAQDWASMLLRMYERYFNRKGWKAQVLHQSFGDPGPEGRIGVKQAVLEVKGKYAYGYLRREKGVHRLVRISPFSAKSLRHTSFASVDVMPELSSEEQKEIAVKSDDLKIDTFRSSGPGGQNVNKRETAVRITHIPTGIVVAAQSSRTQGENREKAMQLLYSKLYLMQEEKREKELEEEKGERKAIEWGSQIRSYVLHPYKLVKDHRTDQEDSNVDAVLDGNLDAFIESSLRIS